jgi:hypothetical protein
MTFLPAVDSVQVLASARELAPTPAPDEPRLSGTVIKPSTSEPLSYCAWVIRR